MTATDDIFDRVRVFVDDLKGLGCEYRVEVQPSATEAIRISSVGYVERPYMSDGNELADVPLDELLDEIRERVEEASA